MTSTTAASELPGELDDRRQLEAVVERADDRDQRRRRKDPFSPVVVGQEQDTGDERAAEDRQAAEQRRRVLGQPDVLLLVDRADAPRKARRERA